MVKEYSFGDHFARIIRTDSKFQFVSFLRKRLNNLGETGFDISQSELLESLCLHRAVKCATVLLEGETGVSVDLNVVLEGGLTPLQLAARCLSNRMTELFLKHGAEANLCNNDGAKDPAMLPLNVALNELCQHEFVSDWTPEKSIFKLFYIFCVPELKEPLDTIKLLASKTDDIEKTIVHIVEGNNVGVIKLAALVMVAWDRVVAPFIEKGIDDCPIRQHILRQLRTLANQDIDHLTTRDPDFELLELNKNKKISLLAQLEIFKIPAKAYDRLEIYRHSDRAENVLRHEIPFDIAFDLFEKAKFVLNPDDVYTNDIKCLRPKLPKEVKDRLNENLEKKMALGSTISMSAPILTNGVAASSLFPSTSTSGLLRTYKTLNFDLTKPFRSPVAHSRAIHAVEPSLSNFLSSASICARLLLAGKKCIK